MESIAGLLPREASPHLAKCDKWNMPQITAWCRQHLAPNKTVPNVGDQNRSTTVVSQPAWLSQGIHFTIRTRLICPPQLKLIIEALAHPWHGRLLLALPKAFPHPWTSYFSGCLMPFVPVFQGAEPAQNYFQALPKILHSLQKPVQGPRTSYWQIHQWANQPRTYGCQGSAVHIADGE